MILRARWCALVGALALSLPAAASAVPLTADPSAPAAARQVGRAAVDFHARPGVKVGGQQSYPRDLAVAPNGRWALVVSDEALTKIGLAGPTPRVLGKAPTLFGSSVAIAQDGKTAYVANDDALYVVNASLNRPKRVKRLGDVVRDDLDQLERHGKRLYATHNGSLADGIPDGVAIFSVARPRQPRRIDGFQTGSLPIGLDVSGNGHRVATANALVGSVTVAAVGDRGHQVLEKELELPFDVASVVTVGTTAYVYAEDDAKIAVVNLKNASLRRIKNFLPGNYGGPSLAVSGDGKYLATLHDQQTDDTTVSIVDRAKLKTVQRFTGVDFPNAVGASGSGPTKGSFFIAWPGSVIDDSPAGFAELAR